MKSFYAPAVEPAAAIFPSPAISRSVAAERSSAAARLEAADRSSIALDERIQAGGRRGVAAPSPARIAVYDAAGAPPRVEEINSTPVDEYISRVAARTYELARGMGGSIPFSVVNEVVENFIHADFCEPVVTILDAGNTIRFSDQGPGIADKRRVMEPGYTTATQAMKRYVRGVGSGLPLASECLSFSGGSLLIEDNLGCGAVVTVSSLPTARAVSQQGTGSAAPPDASMQSQPHAPVSAGAVAARASVPRPALSLSTTPPSLPGFEAPGAARAASGPAAAVPLRTLLTNRQKRVLALVMEAGTAGPSLVARELTIGLSTAYRDLARLEELGLITADEAGKRVLTEAGSSVLAELLHT